MKLPFLILCLVLIYWICIIYAEKYVDSMEDVTNLNEEYISNYQYVPLETSLSRHKRSTMSPLMDIMMKIFRNNTASMLEPAFDIFNFEYGTLKGEIKCPKVEKLSLDSIPKMMLNPIETIQTIVCYVFKKINS